MSDNTRRNKFTPHTIRPASHILVAWSPFETAYARKMIAESKEFFKTYGKGRTPYMIDRRHYITRNISKILFQESECK